MPGTILMSAPSPDRTNLANFERLQNYLGVSRATLLRYVYDRKIAAIKMDDGWRFPLGRCR
jgi:uncharacterized membrane protein